MRDGELGGGVKEEEEMKRRGEGQGELNTKGRKRRSELILTCLCFASFEQTTLKYPFL